AFTVPLGMPLAFAASRHHGAWFFPAAMVVVGAHYLPFVFLYGQRLFAVLCALMVGGGLMLGLYVRESFALGAWITGVLLVLFSLVLRWTHELEERRESTARA